MVAAAGVGPAREELLGKKADVVACVEDLLLRNADHVAFDGLIHMQPERLVALQAADEGGFGDHGRKVTV